MKKHVPSNKNGAILVVVMVVLVAFSLLTVALLQLGSFNERETIRQLRITQAHWLAEAGLERAISWVAASEAYRSSLPPGEPGIYSSLYTELTNGKYAVKIWAPTSTQIVIRSIGITTIGGVSNIVQFSMGYQSGIPGSIIGLNPAGTVTLKPDVLSEGDVYSRGWLKISGMVDSDYAAWSAKGPSYVTGSGSFTRNYIPSPDAPTIDKPFFQTNLSYAADTSHSNVLIFADKNNPPPELDVATLNLGGSIIYINGDTELKKVKKFNGPGMIFVSGNLDLIQTDKTFGDNITVAASGNITFSKGTIFGNNNQIFSQGNIDTKQFIQGGAVALLAVGNITCDQVVGTEDNPFLGIFYAEGNVTMQQSAEIRGTIVAGGDMILGQTGGGTLGNFTVKYDSTVFTNFVDIIDFHDTIIPNGDWQEL